MINPNIISNTILFYDYPSGSINYISVFFSPEFKVNFDDFPKRFAFKVFISISLKCINSNLIIVFVTENDIQSR